MTSASACRNTSLVALALAVAPLVACTAPLVVGDHNDDPQPAIALAYEDLQGWLRPDPEAPDADPTALYIQIDSQKIDCDDQSALDPAVCATGWHLSIAIPPDYVAPGTYDFADPAVRVVLLQGEESGSECTGELGPLTEGTLKIESIDLEGMEVRLDTSALPEAEGRYRVSRCL